MATPLFYSQARRDHKSKSSLWVPSPAFTNSANRAVINSTIASASQLPGGQLLQAEAPAPRTTAGASAPSPLPDTLRCAGAIDELRRPNNFKYQHKHRPIIGGGMRPRLCFGCAWACRIPKDNGTQCRERYCWSKVGGSVMTTRSASRASTFGRGL